MIKLFSFLERKISSILENSFLILLGAYLTLGALRTTSLRFLVLPFFTVPIAVGLVAIIVVRFFCTHTYSTKKTILYAFLFAAILLVVLRNHHDTLMMVFLLVIASKGIDYRKIVIVQLIAVTEVLLFSAVLSQAGITSDYRIYVFPDLLRTFGVCNTTDFASYVLFLLLSYAFLRANRITFAELGLVVFGAMWVYKQTHSRTSCGLLLLFCVLVALYKIRMYLSSDPIKPRILYPGMTIMPLLSLLILMLSIFYSEQNASMCMLNDLFSNRLALGHTGLKQYGIRLFGNNVAEQGYGFREKVTTYFFLDSSYMRLFIIDGLLIFCVIMLIYFKIYKKIVSGENFIAIIVFFIVALDCLTEQHLLEPWYNPLTLMYLAEFPLSNGKVRTEATALSNFREKYAFFLILAVGLLVVLLFQLNSLLVETTLP